jgi:mannosidase alpha-like ER degradation enhancer 3
LQVLKGDVDAAIETFEMYHHLNSEHGFIPESFTAVLLHFLILIRFPIAAFISRAGVAVHGSHTHQDLKPNYAASPIRPEFVESAYYLYRATGDSFYQNVMIT